MMMMMMTHIHTSRVPKLENGAPFINFGEGDFEIYKREGGGEVIKAAAVRTTIGRHVSDRNLVAR